MRRQALLFLMLVLVSLPAGARQVLLGSGSEPFDLELLSATPERSVVELRLNYFDLEAVTIDGAVWTEVALGTRALHLDRGLPALPTLRESLVIPDDGVMGLRVLGVEYTELAGVDVAPSKGNLLRTVDPALVDYAFADFYTTDGWYPAEAAKLETPYILRDTRGLVVELNPFQYNPATHTLRVATRLTVEVSPIGVGGENVLSYRPATRVQDFEQVYARHYLNYTALNERYTSIGEVGSMLVICYDAFNAATQPFVAWKNQMGVPTTLVNVSTIGSTGAQVKAYIQNLYTTSGVTFIVLVGDAAQVPYYNNGGASDPSYAFLAGSDNYPDAFVGRLSAETVAQVETQVTRSIEYERDAQGAAVWYAKGTGIASAQGAGIGDDGEADYQHMDVIRGKLLAFTYNEVDQIYDTNGGTAAMVTAALNAGRSVIDYCGHGSMTSWGTTGFSNTHVNALTNDNKLPFIHSVACNVGEFQSGTCFGEAWLRASHNGEPTGAIGFYGSTISQSWAPPMSAQDETIDLLVNGEKRCWGSLCFNGACLMNDEYGADGQNETKFWTVFGDPSLRVRTAAPQAVAVDHFATVDPLMPGFTVHTDPGNLASLSYLGQPIGAAFANASGTAVVPFTFDLPTPGVEVTLTVSGFNRFTSVEQILVGDGLLPTCEVTPASFFKTMMPDQTQTDYLHISNHGEDGSTLYYSIALSDPDFPLAKRAAGERNMTGSTLNVDLDGFYPGLTYDVVFTAHCVSNDNEWIKNVDFDLPAGVVLNSATDLVGGGGGPIPYAGGTGDGIASGWHGQSTYGNIYPDESASATVNLTFAAPAGDVVIPYTITGDIWGSEPHSVSGQIVISLLGPNVTVLAPNGGELCPVGETEAIRWAAGGGPVNVKVELTRNGFTWETLAASIPAAFGVYNWSVTGPITPHARVRVSDAASPLITDVSNGEFTIYRELTWVQMATTEGTVPEGGTVDLPVIFDTASLPDGVYRANIAITSNAGDPVVVPATVTVLFDPTGVETAPAALALAQNYPNPFNPKTTISFALPAAGAVRLSVFDVSGRRVTTLLDGLQPAGTHHVVWDGHDGAGASLSSGVYFYRLEAAGQLQERKMLLLK